MPAILGRALGLHAPYEILEGRDARAPRLAVLAVGEIHVLQGALPLLPQKRGEEVGNGAAFDPPLDFSLGDDRRDLLAVLLVDLVRRGLDVLLRGLFFRGEE